MPVLRVVHSLTLPPSHPSFPPSLPLLLHSDDSPAGLSSSPSPPALREVRAWRPIRSSSIQRIDGRGGTWTKFLRADLFNRRSQDPCFSCCLSFLCLYSSHACPLVVLPFLGFYVLLFFLQALPGPNVFFFLFAKLPLTGGVTTGREGLKRSPAHVLGTFSHELQIPRPSHICLNTLIAIHSAMFE